MDEKYCSKCKETKNISEFSRKTERWYQSKCKACARLASAEHYRKNPSKYLERLASKKAKARQLANEKRENTPCADCGKFYPYYVMDFDHLPGTAKVGNISMFKSNGDINAVIQEMAKCEIVCSNCHRIRSFHRMKESKTRSIDRPRDYKPRKN